MFSILLSFGRYLIGYFLRAVVLKFIVFTTAFVVITELVPVVVSRILPIAFSTGDKDGGVSAALRLIPDDIWWFLVVFQIQFGLPLVLSAILARFVVRRLHLVR